MTATAIAQLQLMTAAEVCAAAPLGAFIRYTDLAPEPPLRFKNKHAVWRRSNAQGRLISVTPGKNGHPGHFTLHEGDFGTANTVVISFRKTFALDSSLGFAITHMPAPGSVAVLTAWSDIPELQHLASNQQDAEDWMRSHQHNGAYLQPICA
jgi:hypothetical protein